MMKFKEEFGEDYETIMEYCLGSDWKSQKVKGSHIHFNQKLGTDIKGTDTINDSVTKTWKSIKRNSILDEILT